MGGGTYSETVDKNESPPQNDRFDRGGNDFYRDNYRNERDNYGRMRNNYY